MPGVVVGTDGSEGALRALSWAVEEARLAGVPLIVASSYWRAEPMPGAVRLADDGTDVRRTSAEHLVADLTGPYARKYADLTITPMLSAQPAGAYLSGIAENHADLMVVGNRGRGAVRSVLLGSVALHCVAQGRGPVVVVHERLRQPAGPPTVVVGVDGSPQSRLALTTAIHEAGRLAADVEVVAVHEVTNYWLDAYPLDDDQRAAIDRGNAEALFPRLAR